MLQKRCSVGTLLGKPFLLCSKRHTRFGPSRLSICVHSMHISSICVYFFIYIYCSFSGEKKKYEELAHERACIIVDAMSAGAVLYFLQSCHVFPFWKRAHIETPTCGITKMNSAISHLSKYREEEARAAYTALVSLSFVRVRFIFFFWARLVIVAINEISKKKFPKRWRTNIDDNDRHTTRKREQREKNRSR